MTASSKNTEAAARPAAAASSLVRLPRASSRRVFVLVYTHRCGVLNCLRNVANGGKRKKEVTLDERHGR